MPNRIIKESICTSDTLAEVSPQAERLFWRLVVQADDYGCYDGRPKIILGKCMAAMLGAVTEQDVFNWLNELSEAGLVERYECDGRPYIHLTTWETHQRPPRATKRKYPPLLPSDGECRQMSATDDKCGQVMADAPVSVSVSVSVSENVSVSGEDDIAQTNDGKPDPDREAVRAYVRQHHGTWDGDWRTWQELGTFAEELGEQGWVLILEAFIRTDGAHPTNPWKYLKGILRTWREEGIRTVERLRIADEQRRARLQGKPKPVPEDPIDPDVRAKFADTDDIPVIYGGKGAPL